MLDRNFIEVALCLIYEHYTHVISSRPSFVQIFLHYNVRLGYNFIKSDVGLCFIYEHCVLLLNTLLQILYCVVILDYNFIRVGVCFFMNTI